MSINATVDGTVYEGIQTISVGGKSVALAEVGGSGEITRASWHQCPEAVRNYLAYVAAHPYSESDYSATAILDFAPNPANQQNTKPVGYIIDGATFRNNVPLIATPFATANKAGTLIALDKLRWFNTTVASAEGNEYPRGWNCRDLGGWACDGGAIRYGTLVRSGEINAADKSLMVDEIGIKTEVNLLPRSQQATDYSVWGIERVANPTDADFQYGLDHADQWKLYLQTIFRSVAQSRPVIFHCGVGADKTGTLAVMLLGILGCDLSGIDQDYELTTFSAFSTWRNRTYSVYQAYLDLIKTFPLKRGLTDSFQNRCASFALSLGISADEINAFRAACIDGTPTPIEPTIEVYSVTKSLSHATIDNAATEAGENSEYQANLKPSKDYVLSAVSVTMGGADITSQVFSGTETVRRYSLSFDLGFCATDNSPKAIAEDSAFVAHLTADTGYTLDGATVTITMGGTDVSRYYSNGTISIPAVTGDVVITATAVPSAPAFTNLADPTDTYWKEGFRLSLSGGGTSALSGHTTTNFIPAKAGDVLRVKGMEITSTGTGTGSSCKIVGYSTKDVESSIVNGAYGTSDSRGYGGQVDKTGDVSQVTLLILGDSSQNAPSTMQYIRIDGMLISGYTSADVVITINEEIV